MWHRVMAGGRKGRKISTILLPTAKQRIGNLAPNACLVEHKTSRSRDSLACHRCPQYVDARCWRGACGASRRIMCAAVSSNVKGLLADLEAIGNGLDKEEDEQINVREVPKLMRNTLLTESIYRRALKRFGAEPKQLCPVCWLQNRYCVCSRCQKLPSEILSTFPYRILLYVHVKELGSSSNTGSMMSLALGADKTSVLVAGVREHEKEIEMELQRDHGRTVVLFPSKYSQSVGDFLSRNPDADGMQKQNVASNNVGQGLTIIVMEGTWDQARRLVQRFPHRISRLRLSEESLSAVRNLSINSPMRDQVEPDRVCSLTALACLMQELKVGEEVPSHLLKLLRTKAEIYHEYSKKQWKPNKVVSSHVRSVRTGP